MNFLLLRRSRRAFTLVEVVTATAVSALTMAATIYGYTLTSKRAEWAGYSLAAQSLAIQGLEQARAAKWDPWSSSTNSDMLVSSNFAPQIKTLDIPVTGTNVIYATNFWTISTISTKPKHHKKHKKNKKKKQKQNKNTNTVVSYRASDQ